MKALYIPRFGRARILAEPSGFYQPVADGAEAAVLGVVDRIGDVADIVAWLPNEPWRWWARTGAMPVLGEAEIDRAAFLDAPLFLFGTPQDWLLNHDHRGYWPAACVLDWSADPRLIFSGVRIVAHGEAVATQLEAAQRRRDRPLNITVKWNEAERAAA